MGSTLLKLQPALIHVDTKKDLVFTPRWLSRAIIEHFRPAGAVLDPCAGGGAFYDYLPENGRLWCEIQNGVDFLKWDRPVDWVIGNPPYSRLLNWFRHSFTVAANVCYLIPLHRVMGSASFLHDVSSYGGLKEVLLVGTGSTAGFPFGHALAAVHYKKDYRGGTTWSQLARRAIPHK